MLAAAALAFPAAADATFPGTNGRIAYERGNQVWTMNTDGSGQTQITNEANGAFDPAWSPDGQRIAYDTTSDFWGQDLYIVNADGSGRTLLKAGDSQNQLGEPSWSPDGLQLLYVRHYERQIPESDPYPAGELRRINADGTGDTFLLDGTFGVGNPKWGPDGTRYAYTWDSDYAGVPNIGVNGAWMTSSDDDVFHDWRPDGTRILGQTLYGFHDPAGWYTVKANDGTDKTYLPAGVSAAAWSPDGAKYIGVKFVGSQDEVFTWNADGTGATNLTNTSGVNESDPDWQPIPLNYVRPKGASPFQTYLVPAYKPCTAPNRTHGSPLAFPSCSPPTQSSGQLTLGTPDANGSGANGIASVFLATRVGDLKVEVTIRDVRKATDLSDYTGQLDVQTDLRITDRNNTPSPGGPGAATVTDSPLHVPVSCTATGSTTLGSDCNLITTVNSLYPGAITAGQRAVWQLGQVRAYDGGTDGLASTSGDNTLFLTQGIFIP